MPGLAFRPTACPSTLPQALKNILSGTESEHCQKLHIRGSPPKRTSQNGARTSLIAVNACRNHAVCSGIDKDESSHSHRTSGTRGDPLLGTAHDRYCDCGLACQAGKG